MLLFLQSISVLVVSYNAGHRGIISIAGVLAVWELGRRLHVPFFGAVPAPSEVIGAAGDVIGDGKFWTHGMTSLRTDRAADCQFVLARSEGSSRNKDPCGPGVRRRRPSAAQ